MPNNSAVVYLAGRLFYLHYLRIYTYFIAHGVFHLSAPVPAPLSRKTILKCIYLCVIGNFSISELVPAPFSLEKQDSSVF